MNLEANCNILRSMVTFTDSFAWAASLSQLSGTRIFCAALAATPATTNTAHHQSRFIASSTTAETSPAPWLVPIESSCPRFARQLSPVGVLLSLRRRAVAAHGGTERGR